MPNQGVNMQFNLRGLRGEEPNGISTVAPRITKKTLFFTSAGSSSMPLANGKNAAFTGLYKCDFNEDRTNIPKENKTDGDNAEENLQCEGTQKVADGRDRDGKPHAGLYLFNLQFHDSKNEDVRNLKNKQNTTSYLYANTFVDNKRDKPGSRVNSWEIVHAKLPAHEDGTLRFESLFRTLDAFDWNECDFKCCPYDSSTDDDPFEYSKEESNGYYAHTHAYVRVIPRSSAVDEHTGEVFISWEGFYQHCDPANLNEEEEKKLEWTIGISRLRTEDPYCFINQVDVMENNFARCTEPVAIAYQSHEGRDVVLSYGGLTVIPSHISSTGHKSRRSFLLSTLMSPEIHPHRGELTSHVWAIPEGGKPKGLNWFHEHLSLSGNGTVVDTVFMDAGVRNGGTLRLHTNPITGQPDHICRTIFNKGIGCMPIAITEKDESVHIEPQGDEKIVLTEEQVTSFCKLPFADRSKQIDFVRRTTLVTGLDVVWNENEDDGTGSPWQIIFGCHGDEGGRGNFGAIYVDSSQGNANPTRVIPGAYPGSVLFLPQSLENAWAPSSVESISDGVHVSLSIHFHEDIMPFLIGLVVAVVAGCILSCLCCIKGGFSRRVRQKAAHAKYYGVETSYVELQNIDSSDRSVETEESSTLTRSDSCVSLLHIHKD